jgi:hypothetical protein
MINELRWVCKETLVTRFEVIARVGLERNEKQKNEKAQSGRLSEIRTAHELETFPRGRQLYSHSRTPQHFREHEISLLHSQELSICPYSEPCQSIPHHPVLALQDPS